MIIEQTNTHKWSFIGIVKHPAKDVVGLVYDIGSYDYLYVSLDGSVCDIRRAVVRQLKKDRG